MKTLMELIDEAYHGLNLKLPYTSIEEIIGSDENAVEFIRAVLKDDDFQIPEETDFNFQVTKNRAVHSVITFFVGVVFFQFENYQDVLGETFFPEHYNYRREVLRLWMLTALYHDYGYFSKRLGKSDINFRSYVNYYLLDDEYLDKRLKALNRLYSNYQCAFAYTYGEIECYSRYAQWYHSSPKKNSKPGEEKVDHGILGGVLVFDKLIAKELKNDFVHEPELLLAKISCITIAQHNIFKSSSSDEDKNYLRFGTELQKLLHDSNFVIDRNTPLLLLLSLVDTFECIKKLGKKKKGDQSVQTKTVLNRISLAVNEKEILLDYSALDQHIRKNKGKDLQEVYSNYKNSMFGLGHWTSINTEPVDDSRMVIHLLHTKSTFLSTLSTSNNKDSVEITV